MQSPRFLGSDGSEGMPAAMDLVDTVGVVFCPIPMGLAWGGGCDIYRLAYEQARSARRSVLYEWIRAGQRN